MPAIAEVILSIDSNSALYTLSPLMDTAYFWKITVIQCVLIACRCTISRARSALW